MNNKELSEWGKLIKKYQEFVCPAVREGQKKGHTSKLFL